MYICGVFYEIDLLIIINLLSMKKIILSLIAIVMAMSVSAAPVDYATALKKAKNHLATKMYPGMMMSPAGAGAASWILA